MKHFAAFYLLPIFCLLACHTEEKKQLIEGQTNQDSIYSFPIVDLNKLPDSLQPKSVLLSEKLPPKTFQLSESRLINSKQKGFLSAPERVNFPILRDFQGQAILDNNKQTQLLTEIGLVSFSNFSLEHGLPTEEIIDGFTDRLGVIWLLCPTGLLRYDGSSFEKIPILINANTTAMCMLHDSKGTIWIGTNTDGLYNYDGHRIVHYTKEDGLGGDSPHCLAEDKAGRIWIATAKGISIFDGETFTNLSDILNSKGKSLQDPATALCMKEDTKGRMWLGNWYGLHFYNGDSLQSLQLGEGFENATITRIAEDVNGNLWFGTVKHGLLRYDGKKTTSFSKKQGLISDGINDIMFDSQGNLWISTNEGLSYFDKTQFHNFTTKQGLASNIIFNTLEDYQKNIWAFTTGGLSRLNSRDFSTISTDDGLLNNTVNSIAQDTIGRLFFGTWNGISMLDNKGISNYTKHQGIPEPELGSICIGPGNKIWASGSGSGLSCLSNNRVSQFTTKQGLLSNFIRCMISDSDGKLWFGTHSSGIGSFDGSRFKSYPHVFAGKAPIITDLIQDRDKNIWFATQDHGIACLSGNKMFSLSEKHGLVSNETMSLLSDQSGNIWIATNDGIMMLPNEERVKLLDQVEKSTNGLGEPPAWKHFSTADGLPTNSVIQFAEDKNGDIWVGTSDGITSITPKKDGKWIFNQIFNPEHGYPVGGIGFPKDNNLFIDEEGILWIGTNSIKTNLVRFDKNTFQKRKAGSQLLLKNISLNETPFSWSSLYSQSAAKESDSTILAQQELLQGGSVNSQRKRDSLQTLYKGLEFESLSPYYFIPQSLVLPFQHNRIRFDFAMVETGINTLLAYRYILEGYSKDWSPATSNATAFFENVPEGNYTFKFMARNSDGKWTKPLTYSFIIQAPWWRTWWAYTIFTLSGIGIVYLFIRERERGLRRKNERLESIVKLRTKEVLEEKKKSDDLLLNILPSEIAEELKTKGGSEAQLIDQVTVLFTDFKGFTQMTAELGPKELVEEINTYFSAFDLIMQKHGVEKIKTIGDAYMAAGGLPVSNTTHAKDVVDAALDIQAYMKEVKVQKEAANQIFFELRIGIHTGPVVAGIVGIKKFAYDIWGDTVNTASRMESSGEVGKVNISETTYEMVKLHFTCTYRGKIEAKGKGVIDMYFVEEG